MLSPSEISSMSATVVATFDREAVVRRRGASGVDDNNDPVATWTNGSPVPCGLVHRAGRETTTARDSQITDWTCRLPPATAIAGRDLIYVSVQDPEPDWADGTPDGVLYEVIGPPERFGTHVRAELRHVEGG